MDEARSAQAARDLSLVIAARLRLSGGDYGFCQECGEPMEEARLLAYPQAPYCVTCQSSHEDPHERA